MNAAAQRIVTALGLEPLPHEGGFFRQTWRGAAGSAIYFLLTADDFSALHRLRTDELWHFYAGDPVEHVQLDPRGGADAFRSVRLGPNVLGGECPQLLVPAGVWQGARLAAWETESSMLTGAGPSTELRAGPSTELRAGWALLGCTLAPPWDETHFELGAREALLRGFPERATIVRALTR